MKVVLVFGAVSIAGAIFDALSGFQAPGSGDTEDSPLDGFSAGSENVSKNQFYVGFSWPVPVSSGYMTGWVSSPCYAALMLMRFCGSAPVCLCGFCPADAACRWLLIYFGVLPFLWFRNLCWTVASMFMACAVVHNSSRRCNIVTAASHTAAGILVRLPHSSLLPSSCLPPLPLFTLPLCAVTLTLQAAVAFSLVSPRRLPRCWSPRSSSCSCSLSRRRLLVCTVSAIWMT